LGEVTEWSKVHAC